MAKRLVQQNNTSSVSPNSLGIDPNELQQVLGLAAAQKGQYGTAWSILQPQKETGKQGATEIQKINAMSGLDNIKTVEDELKKSNNNIIWRAALPGPLARLAGASTYIAATKEIQDVFTRLRTGAALNNDEITFYQSQLPSPFDKPEDIKYKLKIFRNLYSRVAGESSGYENNAPETNGGLPSSFQEEEQ